ncbi:MAG: precorrin-3B C(17)-methyltransferase [Actinomycetota bacterium]
MIGLIAVTAAGRAAVARLADALPDTRSYDGPATTALPQAFEECDLIVCFLAVGATVRIAAPLLAGKYEDPGVVCVDEALRYAVPVLGGHAGGSNVLARHVAEILGATAVITTASDAMGSVALDEFGADIGFVVEPGSDLAAVGAAILSGARVTLTMDPEWPVPPLPPAVVRASRPEAGVPALVVTDGDPGPAVGPRVVYRPPSLVVGAGASSGVSAAEAGQLMDQALASAGLSPRSVCWLATADIKAREPGLVVAAAERGWPIATAPAGQLAGVSVPTPSEVVRAAVGTPSVAEAAALLTAVTGRDLSVPGPGTAPAVQGSTGTTDTTSTTDISGTASLVVAKQVSAHATAAVARRRPRGRLAIVGIGPGARDLLTPRAIAELRRASVVVGLDQYVRQIADLIPAGTRVLPSGLGAEEQRAAAAVNEALAGRAVALIGSGDAGIYAMASPALGLADERIDVVGVPGVTAALAAAAVLGAPLGHDHAFISLSDLHTPWEVIEQRVRAIAAADLVACLYNPASQARTWQFPRALAIIAAHRPPQTPVGWVRDASRGGQRSGIATLADLDPAVIDMHTLVVVGSSRTTLVAGRMVTPREYRWAAP